MMVNVVCTPHSDWEVWMFAGNRWYEPGENEGFDPPYWSQRVPEAPRPTLSNKGAQL